MNHAVFDAWPSGGIQLSRASVVEKKFLGVAQRPKNIFVAFPGFICRFAILIDSLAFQITHCHVNFRLARQPGKRLIVKAVYLRGVIPSLVIGELGGATLLVGQLLVNVLRVKQVQTLGEAGFLRAFAFAGAGGIWPAKHTQKIVGTRVYLPTDAIPQSD